MRRGFGHHFGEMGGPTKRLMCGWPPHATLVLLVMHTSCSYRTRRSRRSKSRSVAAQFSPGLADDLYQSLSLIARYAEQAETQLDHADFDRQEVRDALQLIYQETLGSWAILTRLLNLAPDVSS